ncbi:MAG: DUF2281 domain-containing protein [Ignavibacteriae bacterium]|nr:DUF2281 domain-containing protein [Ignavibacteriota bacterium]
MSTTLVEKIEKLPPKKQKEVEVIVERMIEQQEPESEMPWKFDWEGALKDMRDEYTSVELQHAVTKLWRQGVSR